MTKDSPVRMDETFAALGNAKRRGMIETLSYRPASVSQLASEFNLSLPAMHKHLRQLEKAKLIKRRKSGRVNYLALNRPALAEAKTWLNQFHTEWGSSRETLDNYIASLN